MLDDAKTYDLETRVIHGGQEPDPLTGAIMQPIYATSTYVQAAPGEHKGFEYSRTQNPTRFVYERAVANIENGKRGFAFASGLAASATILEFLKPGDHVIAMDDLYGGTYRLFQRVRKETAGIEFTFIDFTDLQKIKNAIKSNTKLIWLESPSNPLLKIVNLKEVAQLGKQHKIITVCDNTFATPILQQPLNFGFDLVVNSATKYINGHSDIISGIVVVGDNDALSEKLQFLQNAVGAIPSPFDCYLALRGMKTLAIRMERHSENALELAEWLASHPQVKRIYYPGLKNHPQYELAKQQMRYFGGMISVELKCNLENTKRFLSACRIFQLAESLGSVESLVNHPAIMTHATIPTEIRNALGITDSLIRLSVGIENIKDLQNDLQQAFNAIHK